MFFHEEKNVNLSDLSIPTVFFDQIMPVIDGKYVKVYLYGYHLSKKDIVKEDIDNKKLSSMLKVSLEDVLEAWDFLESCGLVKKHQKENGLIWDYSIEFLDLKALYLNKPESKSSVTTDELLLLSKNNHLKNMFDSIEAIVKRTLNYNEIRTINEFMKEYSVQSSLVVEAFSFCVTMKKSKTVNSALSILRTWILDGISNEEDLKSHLNQRHQRYSQYRRILSMMGEYRLPSKAEEKLMDSWLDDMNFSMEVIEVAFEKSTSIKTPNLSYINGILKNWSTKLSKRDKVLEFKSPNASISSLEFRTTLIEEMGRRKGLLSKEEDNLLNYLYSSFPIDAIISGIRHLKKEEDNLTLSALTSFLSNPSQKKEVGASEISTESSKISIEDIKDIIDEKASKRPSNTKSKASSRVDDDELKKKLKMKMQK